MTCSVNQINVSMWNTILGWNGLNKSKSIMTVIIKFNTVQIGVFQCSQKLRVGRGYKKVYVGVREMTLGKSLKNLSWKRWKLENVLKLLKLSTNSIKFHWRQQLLSEVSKVTNI